MSDYDAIFQAVRSKIVNGDIGAAVESVLRDQNFSFYVERMCNIIAEDIGLAYCRPSAVYKPRIAKDGNAWIACLGDNLQEGVVGVGDTPEEAMRDFDKNWNTKDPNEKAE